MDENMEKQPQEAKEETTGYVPRPAWQVWCARVALVLFIIIVFGQIAGTSAAHSMGLK